MSLTQKLNKRQLDAIRLLNDVKKKFILLYGAARSGKTFLICWYFILTANKYPGCRLLLGRYRFNHAKLSVWKQTLLPLLRETAKGMYTENSTDYIIQFSNGSEIWLAGFDDKERADKVLSMEFARIAIIECFQLSFETFQLLFSRLNTDVPGLQTKLIGDGNPRGKKHWTYKVFFLGVHPKRKGEDIKNFDKYGNLKFRVEDNEENLSEGYIEDSLDSLSGVQYARLRQGDFADLVEGQVYWFDREVNHSDEPIPYDSNLPVYTGWDFGIHDDTFIVCFQVAPLPNGSKEIRIINEYVNNNKDYMHYRNWMFRQNYLQMRHAGDPAGKSRGAKLDSWFSLLDTVGIYLESPSKKFTPADMIESANRLMHCIRVNEVQCPEVVEMFENWAYPQDKDGGIKEASLPEHNKWSHPGTALYYGLAIPFPPRPIIYSMELM